MDLNLARLHEADIFLTGLVYSDNLGITRGIRPVACLGAFKVALMKSSLQE